MQSIYAKNIYLEDSWQKNVRLDISNGVIQDIKLDATTQSQDEIIDILIPGLCNAHNHSFQRAMSGLTEFKPASTQDNFWTWRETMYQLVEQVDASIISAIAAQAYQEMLENGYTSVVEFHYLHREQGTDEFNHTLLEALVEAATSTGIRLIYTPVLYQRGGFKDEILSARQEQFYLTCEELILHYQYAKSILAKRHSLAIGVHSLRAVTNASMQKIVDFAKEEQVPFHLHIAEQQKEVMDFYEIYEKRPVEWLMDNYAVDENWCLVHATHLDEEELNILAKSGAVVCLCPTTEANLGDGIFKLHDYVTQGGKLAIGSDSNISINPFEELRWLEYVQRLVKLERNITSSEDRSSGYCLFNMALDGGALASGNKKIGSLKKGGYADFLELSSDNPSLVAHETNTLLDAIIFSNHNSLVNRIMIHGEWLMTDPLIKKNFQIAMHKISNRKSRD
jgi:formimidoylglutamate deiminase